MNTNYYKDMLLKEKQEITKLVAEMKDNTVFGNTTNTTSERYTSGELSSYDNHPADIGTEVYMDAMQNSLTNHEKEKLNNINNALNKIENGTYGKCDECGMDIDEDRLEIIPETSLCMHCSDKNDTHTTNYNEIENTRMFKSSNFYSNANKRLADMNKSDTTDYLDNNY